MKTRHANHTTYRLPSQLNSFQEELYIHLVDWKRRNLTEECGIWCGHSYDAILPDHLGKELALIYPGARQRFSEHMQRFPFRIHRHFHHMASSQAACVNLFLPILQHPLAADILRHLKPDLAELATDRLDQGFRVEFWDEPRDHLGDKTDFSGTDCDLAIAYYNPAGDLCLWLIEHKLTEKEFSVCNAARSRGRKTCHDCKRTFAELADDPSPCYYHDVRNFKYWEITARHRDFFVNHEHGSTCPFKDGMNQLWRNQLLALAMEEDEDSPWREVTFSVIHHPGNTALDETLASYRRLTAENPKFFRFTLTDAAQAAENVAREDPAGSELKKWLDWYRELYRV